MTRRGAGPARVRALVLTLEPGGILVLLSDGNCEYSGTDGGGFGEHRVIDLVAEHRREPTDAKREPSA